MEENIDPEQRERVLAACHFGLREDSDEHVTLNKLTEEEKDQIYFVWKEAVAKIRSKGQVIAQN